VGHDAKEVAELHPVTSTPRLPQAPELVEGLGEGDGPVAARPVLDIVNGTVGVKELPGISDVG
jgi:hypothetical protein